MWKLPGSSHGTSIALLAPAPPPAPAVVPAWRLGAWVGGAWRQNSWRGMPGGTNPGHAGGGGGGGGGGPSPGWDFEEDFSAYSSSANMKANLPPFWDQSFQLNPSWITLDTTKGKAPSTKSCKYTFPAQPGAVDTGTHLGALVFTMVAHPGPTEAWYEFECAWEPTWSFDDGQAGAKEYKLGAVGDVFTGNNRFNIPEMEASQWIVNYPGGDLNPNTDHPLPSDLLDGNFHNFKAHLKIGDHATNGVVQMSIDGVTQKNVSNLAVDANTQGLSGFIPGLNLNQGPTLSQSMWWGLIRGTRTDPGWTF